MLAQKKGRSWSLAAAMLDPRLEVFKCTREGVVEHFCDEELQERNKNVAGAAWKRVEPLERVSRPGRPLAVKGAEAVEYRLARRTAANFNDFKAGYGLELDPRLMEEGWADTLIKALANPLVTFFLLVIGGVAIYIELHAPGIGVGAFVATVCFVLFFWSHALAGSAGWLEVLLFVTGVVCILLEIFVLPGFGIFGLGGGLLVLASLVLASQTFVGLPKTPSEVAAFQRSLITVGGAAIAVMATIVLINRWLPRAPMLGHIVLEPPSREEAAEIARSESLTHFEDLLGVEGTATTPLVPGGKVRLQGQILDAVTDGDFVNRGQRIVVTEVHGNRIVVRAVEE
jgi:hypothetical protein